MIDNSGDQHLRDAGIVLPCAKQFGIWGVAESLANCDRPFGHTGAHAADGATFTGARDPDDDQRTIAVLERLVNREGAHG